MQMNAICAYDEMNLCVLCVMDEYDGLVQSTQDKKDTEREREGGGRENQEPNKWMDGRIDIDCY